MREHRGTVGSGVAIGRPVRAALEPGEQLTIGRREAGPDQLDLPRVVRAERGSRRLGKPRRDTDAQASGHELQQRPASGLLELVEPARDLAGQLGFAERGQRGNHLRQRECVSALVLSTGGRRPHERDGLGQIADIVVGQLEQHRIRALRDQRADHSRFGMREGEHTGKRRQRPSTLGIGRAAKIVRHQPQLVVAAGFICKAIEQLGEAVHGVSAESAISPTPSLSSSSPYPTMSSGRARKPCVRLQWTSASS